MEPTNPFGTPQPAPAPDNSQLTSTPSATPMPPSSAPITSVVPPTDPNEPKKKSHLGLILGLSIGGFVVLVGVVLLILFLTVWSGLNKTDWQTAIDHVKKIDTIMNDSSSVSSLTSLSSDSTTSDVTRATDQIKTVRNNLQQAMTDLGNTRAIKNDKTANDKFQTLQSKHAAFDKELNSMYELLDQCGSAIITINGLSSIDTSDESAVQAALSSLKTAASELSSANLSDSNLNNATHTLGDKLTALINALSAYMNNSSDLTAMDNYYSALDDFETATTNWSDAVNKVADSSTISDFETAYDDLLSYLTSQLNK